MRLSTNTIEKIRRLLITQKLKPRSFLRGRTDIPETLTVEAMESWLGDAPPRSISREEHDYVIGHLERLHHKSAALRKRPYPNPDRVPVSEYTGILTSEIERTGVGVETILRITPNPPPGLNVAIILA